MIVFFYDDLNSEDSTLVARKLKKFMFKKKKRQIFCKKKISQKNGSKCKLESKKRVKSFECS